MNPLFAPESMYWRVNREWLIALAGPRAVLLELAHPAIAAGIAQHSNYRGDPGGRLYRTMKTMTEISFGTPEEMGRALKHFHAAHARVSGTMDAPAVSGQPSVVPYTARDPQLQFWVLATLIDSVPRAYEKFVMPLTYAEKSAYYADCQRLARVLGISPRVIPVTYLAFEKYMSGMLNGDTLTVTEDARQIVNALFAPTLRGRLTRRFSSPSIGMLPPRLRNAYGFEWNTANEKNLARLARIISRVRPHIPRAVAIHPKAWSMERNLELLAKGATS